MSKTIDIFIKTFKPDFWLLQIALKTISRNVSGYNNIILLIPEKDKHDFDTRDMPERTLIHYVEERSPGWLWQQVCKINAHKFSNADYIMFSDSDCFFDHPINLQDYIKNDKPEILYTDWSLVGDAICWRKPTEEILGEPAEWETMRRNNQLVHRDTLIKLNEWKPGLDEIIMKMDRFSEFNLICSWAMKHDKGRYIFTNTANWTYVPPLAIQCWSHGKRNGTDIQKDEYIKTLEAILKSFGIIIPA